MTVSTYTPAREVAARLVSVFRLDPILNGPAPTLAVGYVGGLLFPDWSARTHLEDDRVYTLNADLPAAINTRENLPRIAVATRWQPHDYEQDPEELTGSVEVRLHVITPREQEEYADRLAAVVIRLALSTQLSTDRILASGLYMVSDPLPKSPIDAFEGAWEVIMSFRSGSGSVIK